MLKFEKEVKDDAYHFELNDYKKIIIYVGIMMSLLMNIYSMQIKGYPIGEIFFAEAFAKDTTIYKVNFLKQYGYLLSDIVIGEPLSLLTNSIPYLENDEMFKSSYSDIMGYFTPNEANKTTNENNVGDSQTQQVEKNTFPQIQEKISLSVLKDPQYVFDHFMTAKAEMEFGVDMIKEWDFSKLARQPIRLNERIKGPQVLIFHTHSREEYKDGITVIDVAEALREKLESEYGISVLHIEDSFYEASNEGNRPTGGEYETMEPVIRKILDENPSISVVIDMHRDGVNENIHLVTDIQGKPTAKIMFVTPLCRNRNVAGEVVDKVDIPNPYLNENLAFALQMYLVANEYYPGIARKIFASEWRYSTHMKPQSLLVEWGAQTNTAEEVFNAVEPVAQMLAKVLGKG